MAKVFALAPAARKAETADRTPANEDGTPSFIAKPVEDPADTAEVRRRVMARHPGVRADVAH